MGGVPSKPGNAETQLQVIGAGYSRTGTTSMQLALEKVLDGPVMRKQLLDEILTPSRRNTSPLWPCLKGLITLVI